MRPLMCMRYATFELYSGAKDLTLNMRHDRPGICTGRLSLDPQTNSTGRGTTVDTTVRVQLTNGVLWPLTVRQECNR